jgi:hypothetical protein
LRNAPHRRARQAPSRKNQSRLWTALNRLIRERDLDDADARQQQIETVRQSKTLRSDVALRFAGIATSDACKGLVERLMAEARALEFEARE